MNGSRSYGIQIYGLALVSSAVVAILQRRDGVLEKDTEHRYARANDGSGRLDVRPDSDVLPLVWCCSEYAFPFTWSVLLTEEIEVRHLLQVHALDDSTHACQQPHAHSHAHANLLARLEL